MSTLTANQATTRRIAPIHTAVITRAPACTAAHSGR
jgi:hypothetical protein